jgi:diguanylate cyclase (GGDEF)-like protein
MGRVTTVGRLRISLDPRSVGEDFIAYGLTTLFGNLLRSLLLGLVLAWSMHRTLARPIIGIAEALQAVDPDRPLANPIAMPSGHADDELGQLVNDINSTLGLLQKEQERLFNLATRDQLTGLPNRALLIERLNAALGRAAQTGAQVGILFLDLDRFKQINDTLGHGLGDALLDAVGRRLVSCVKAQDTVGRLGGDEFMIVLEGISERAEVEKVAERIIRAITRVFTLDRHSVYASTAVGIAL